MDRAWASVLALTLAAGGLGYWYAGNGDDAPVPLVPEVAEQPATSRPVASTPARGATGAPQPGGSDAPRLPIQPASGPSKGPGQPTAWSAEPPVQVEKGRVSDGDERWEFAPRTGPAAAHPIMSALDLDDPAYDATIEARQRFYDFEMDLVAAGRLTQATWDTVSARHADAKQRMLDRSVELVEEGYGDESEALLVEWGLLEAHYEGQVE